LNLAIENISKKYKDTLVVKNFSAQFSNGVYGLLGPNGSGKTTLMKIIVDILKPTNGRILVNENDIVLMDDKYRELLGYLPQEFGYYVNFTVDKFLRYIAALKGLEKNYAKMRIDELLEFVNLSQCKNKKIKTLSGGMKQRIGIVQALLNDPKILVLDEPTSGLDPKERVRFRNLISEISSERIIILSTHIVSDIQYISKEVLLMKEGILIKKDTSKELLKEMKGKVWSMQTSEEALTEVKDIYKVVNIVPKDDCIELRIISEEKPVFNAVEVTPTLEDLYMYYFDEEVEE
jgi:ABC-type multidrug transport system ATPase subunit